MFWPASAFSGMVRVPVSVDGNAGASFTLPTVMVALIVLEAPDGSGVGFGVAGASALVILDRVLSPLALTALMPMGAAYSRLELKGSRGRSDSPSQS